MKHYLKQLFKTPMFLVMLLISIFYGLPALGMDAELDRYSVVTAIGIDVADESDENRYEVSLLAFVPVAEQSFAETYKVISSSGRSVSEAMDLAGLNIGREIGLSHVKTVVLNSELLQQDVSEFLDYLSRSKHLAESTKLIATDVSAKEFLSAVQKLDSESSIKISELINYNNDYIYSADSSFELFFKGYFGPTKVSLIPFLTLEQGSVPTVIDSSGSGGSAKENEGEGKSQGQQISSNPEQKILNNGDTILFKNGKYVTQLSGLDMKKINLLQGNFKTGSIEVENFTGEIFKNANLIFEILNQNVKTKVVFENGIPVVLIDIKLTLMLSEIESKEGMIEENAEFYVVTDEVTNAVEQVVRERSAQALQIMRDNQADIPNFYTIMHNSDKKQFENFLSSLEERDNYLSHTIFKVGVSIFTK